MQKSTYRWLVLGLFVILGVSSVQSYHGPKQHLKWRLMRRGIVVKDIGDFLSYVETVIKVFLPAGNSFDGNKAAPFIRTCVEKSFFGDLAHPFVQYRLSTIPLSIQLYYAVNGQLSRSAARACIYAHLSALYRKWLKDEPFAHRQRFLEKLNAFYASSM